MKRSMVLLIAMTLAVVACSGDDETVELTTTTTVAAATDTTQAESEPSTDTAELEEPEGDTTTTPAGESVDTYDVMVQTTAADGDELWILIDPGSYTSVDLENFVIDLLDSAEDPIRALHVFDDAAALDAGRIDPESRTSAEQALVDQHYLVSVSDGVTAEFQGPYTAFGGFTFGS